MGARGLGRGTEWAKLIEALKAEGYRVTVGRSGHFEIWNSNDKRVWSLPFSPSDHRSYLNCLRDLKRRIGFELPKKGRA